MQRKQFIIVCLAAVVISVALIFVALGRKPSTPLVAAAPTSTTVAPRTPSGATPSTAPGSATSEPTPAATPAPEPVAATVEYSGIVFDEATRLPVAGAIVGFYIMSAAKSPCGEPEPEVSVIADSEGRFRLQHTRPDETLWGFIGARAAGYMEAGMGTRSYNIQGKLKDIPSDGFDIGLVRGRDQAVRVVADDDGSPIPAASVVLTEAAGFAPDASDQVMMMLTSRGVTGPAGTCTLATAAREDRFMAMACAEGFVSQGVAVLRDKLGSEVEIRLQRCSASIEGYVRDLKGAPLENVMVNAMQKVADGGIRAPMQATTDAQGHYAIECAIAGTITIAASPLSDRSFGSGVDVTLEKGERGRVDFREEEMGVAVIAGKVTRKDTGKPVPGVKLSSSGGMWMAQSAKTASEFGSATTAADGSYKLKVRIPKERDAPRGRNGAFVSLEVPEGLVVVSDQYQVQMSGAWVQGVASGTTTQQDFLLSPSKVLRGVVVRDEDGEPVAGSNVVYYARSGRMSTPKHGSSGPGGKFEFQVDEYRTGELIATTDTASGSVMLPDPPNEGPYEIRLRKGGTISGVVLDDVDNPVGGVGLMAERDNSANRGAWPSAQQPRNATSNPDGTFKIEGVQEGPIIINGFEGYGPMMTKNSPSGVVEPVRLTIEDGESREDVVVRFAAGFCIRGIVVDEDDRPIAEAQVNAISFSNADLNSYRQPAFTQKDGRFEICNLPNDASFQVQAYEEGYASDAIEGVTSLAGELKIIMRKAPELKLKVVREGTREPIRSIEWRIVFGGVFGPEPQMVGERGRDVSDDGEYSLKLNNRIDSSQGLQVAELDAAGQGTGFRGSVQVDSGEDQVTVVVGKSRTIRGRVVKPGTPPVPVAGAVVEASNPNNRFGGVGVTRVGPFDVPPESTDAAGNFTLRGLGSGSYFVKATKDELTSKWVPVEVPQGSDPEPITLEVLGLGRVYGKVTGPDGSPLEGAVVTIGPMMVPASQHQTATSDAAGRYEIRDIVPFDGGSLSATAMDGLLEKRTSCLIVPGEEWEYDFDFSGLVRLRGRITVNGQPPPARRGFSITGPEGNNPAAIERIQADGSFDAMVPSGEAHLAMESSGAVMRDAVTPFEIPSSPFEQTRNFDISVFPAAVAIALPPGKPMPDNVGINVWVEPPGEKMTPVLLGKVTQTEIAIPFVRAGLAYAAFYNLDGSGVIARSPKVPFAPGDDNILVVTVEE